MNRTLLVALGFATTLSCSSWAQSIVSWGPSPDYVTSNTNASGLSSGSVAFSDTEARSPNSPYPNGETSGTFYGGATTTNANGIGLWRVLNGSSGGYDVLDFGGGAGATGNPGDSWTAVYIWNKEDFLNGFDMATSVTVTSFSADLYNTASAVNEGTVRWAVEVGGSYYVSDSFTVTGTVATYTLTDLLSVSWYSYSPSDSITVIGAEWSTPNFSDVSAVGIWFDVTNVSESTSSSAEGRIASFSVAAIPEPETSSMILGGVALLSLLVLRRKNRR